MANFEILANASSHIDIPTGVTGASLSDFTFTTSIQSHLVASDGIGTLALSNYNADNGKITIGWTSGSTPDTPNFNNQNGQPFTRGTINYTGGGEGDPHITTLDGTKYTL